jgi:hypothetical protein
MRIVKWIFRDEPTNQESETNELAEVQYVRYGGYGCGKHSRKSNDEQES